MPNESIKLDLRQQVIVTRNTGKDGVTRTFARTVAPDGLNLKTDTGTNKWLTVFFGEEHLPEVREALAKARQVTTSGKTYWSLGTWQLSGNLVGENLYVEAAKRSNILNLNDLANLL